MIQIKNIFKYLFFIWPFVYSNARLVSQEGGTDIYSIFSFIGPEFRYFEALIFISINIYIYLLYIFKNEKINPFLGNILLLIILVSIVSAVSIVQGLAPSSYIFRASYELICPFLIFNIASKLDLNHTTIDNFLKILFLIMVINSVVILHQFLFLFNGIFVDGDYFRGIFSDAHVQAIFSFSSAIFIISNKYFFKKFYYLVPVNIFCAVLSSNEKASIFFLFIILGIFLSKISRRNLLIFIPILILMTINIPLLDIFSPRLFEYLDNFSFSDLLYFSGPIQMFLILLEQFSSSVKNIFFGIGPALFGGPSCISLIQNFLAPSSIANIFYVEAFGQFEFLPLSGFFSKSSFYLTVLGEFGLIVFIVFFNLLKNILFTIIQLHNNFLNQQLLSIFIFILLCALLSSYSVWDSQVVLTPLFLILSYSILNMNKVINE